MLFNLLVLLGSVATWTAILWLAIVPNFAKWTNLGIVALHALPPLAVWLIWIVIRHRIRIKKNQEAAAREQQAQMECQAAREIARKKHDEAIKQRRFGCDCRAITIADVALNSDLPLFDSDTDNVNVQSRSLEEACTSIQYSILDQLSPAIKNALTSIYDFCGAAAAFPIFILPPSDVSGEECLSLIRSSYATIVDDLGLQIDIGISTPPALFLPFTDSAANSAIALFDSNSDLPGAVILAFDSPLARNFARISDDDIDPALKKKEQQVGKPSEGVFALLLTNPDLASMLEALANVDDGTSDEDSMKPYWRKSLRAEGYLALLGRVNRNLRDKLLHSPVLGRIHRAASHDAPTQPAGVLEMTRLMQESLEQAQINAGIIELPFMHDESSATDASDAVEDQPSTSNSPAPIRCRWLVHNAGGVDYAGKRLAALGSAMYYFNIDLNPVDIEASTNIVTRVGDLGRATGIGQLALSIAHAADTGTPTLCTEFNEHGGFAFSFVTPQTSGA